MARPLVSVIMSVYNGAKFLRPAIESILDQDCGDFEFLITDDCSADESVEIISSYEDSRIKLIRNPENIGLTRSLNNMLELCEGKFIARMDSDDISLPERLKKQTRFMEENPEILLLGTNCLFIDEAGENCNFSMPFFPADKDLNDDLLRWRMLFPENYFIHTSVLLKAEVLKKNGLRYDSECRYAQDIEFWHRLRNRGKMHVMAQPLVLSRVVNSSITSRKNEQQRKVVQECINSYRAEFVEESKEQNSLESLCSLYEAFVEKCNCLSLEVSQDAADRFWRVWFGNLIKSPVRALSQLKRSLSQKPDFLTAKKMLIALAAIVKRKALYLISAKRKLSN